MDLYEARRTLKVRGEANLAEINKAWRQAALRNHPDLHVGSAKQAAEARMREINEARVRLVKEMSRESLEIPQPRNLMVELLSRWNQADREIGSAYEAETMREQELAYASEEKRLKDSEPARRDRFALQARCSTAVEVYSRWKDRLGGAFGRLNDEHYYAKKMQEAWLLQLDEDEEIKAGRPGGKIFWGPQQEEEWSGFLQGGLGIDGRPQRGPSKQTADGSNSPHALLGEDSGSPFTSRGLRGLFRALPRMLGLDGRGKP